MPLKKGNVTQMGVYPNEGEHNLSYTVATSSTDAEGFVANIKKSAKRTFGKLS